jgi:2-iminobutanoate/2-iminopropanoate deaminase
VPKTIVTSAAAPTTGFTDLQKPPPIAQAVRFGNMLFVSGQGPLDPVTKSVIEADIEAQTRTTLDNLLNVLEAGGATLKNVVNVRVILRDVADFPRFNEVFRSYFENDRVTRTCVGGTPHRKGVNVEIDCIAMFD